MYVFVIKIMKAYKQFITTVGKLLGGDKEMEKRAEEIIALETKLAKVLIRNWKKSFSILLLSELGWLDL